MPRASAPRTGLCRRLAALVLAFALLGLPSAAPAFFFEGTENSWFHLHPSGRARLVAMIRALPTVRFMSVGGCFGSDFLLNGKEMLPDFLLAGTPAAHRFALEAIASDIRFWQYSPDHVLFREHGFVGPKRMRARLELPDYLQVCREENVDPEHYRATAELLADLSLSGYLVICDREDVERHADRPDCTYGSARPVGISLYPWFHMQTEWYYAEDGIAPPETAPYGVIPMARNWYKLTP